MPPSSLIQSLRRALWTAAACSILLACGVVPESDSSETVVSEPPSSVRQGPRGPNNPGARRSSDTAPSDAQHFSRGTRAPIAGPSPIASPGTTLPGGAPSAASSIPLPPRRPVVVGPPAIKPLIAAPERFGIAEVRLYPVENIVPGSVQLITFGLPFPRGSVAAAADLSNVRVIDANGNEIPAFVEALTPWRHLADPLIDGASVRIARIQLRRSLAVAYPNFETVRVEWGFRERSRSLPALENPRNGWQAVTSGSFVAADGVSEPRVYAVLQASTLSKGMLKLAPMTTFVSAVAPGRDDPAAMDATEHYPEFQEQMYASKNFFYAHINEDDPRVTAANQTPYKAAEGEPWLYDRVSAFYTLYFRSGFFKALRESVRASEYYRLQLHPAGTVPDLAVGTFKLKNPNPAAYIGANGAMYSYPEGLAYTHWLTGDELSKDAVRLAAKAQEDANDEPDRWSPTASYTERHIGIKLMAHTVAYELFGDVPYKSGAARTYRERVSTIADNLIWHQNGAGGALPANRIDGGLWKYGSQEGNGPSASLLVSFWQTPFVIEPMVRIYALSDRADIANFVRRSGTALKFAGKSYPPAQRSYRSDVPENLGLVDYVTLIDGSTYAADGAGPEHALSVAGALAWSHYFSRLTQQRDDSLRQAALDLYRTYSYETNEWTRPAGPASGLSAYRNSPWRRYNWTYKTSGHLAWCLSDVRSIVD